MSQKTDRRFPGAGRKARVRREPVRVKRWGKSPPRRARVRRQDKPSRVQGKIGDGVARSIVPGMSHAAQAADPAPGGVREMNAARRPVPGLRVQNPAYSPRNQPTFFAVRQRRAGVGRINAPGPRSAGLSLDAGRSVRGMFLSARRESPKPVVDGADRRVLSPCSASVLPKLGRGAPRVFLWIASR